MKEQIEKILEDEFGLVEAVTFTIGNKKKTVYFSDLAARLDKAIGIDEEHVTEILEQTMKDYDLTGFVKREIVTINYKMRAEAIATSRPLKCEVGE